MDPSFILQGYEPHGTSYNVTNQRPLSCLVTFPKVVDVEVFAEDLKQLIS